MSLFRLDTVKRKKSRSVFRLLFSIALAAGCAASPMLQASEATGFESLSAPVRIGISEFADYSINLPVIPATIELLKRELGPENVEVRTYSVANLLAVAKAGKVDIIFSSAGAYRRLSIEGAGVRDLATVVSNRASNPNYADGSVFFTLSDRSDINSIADLKGRVVSANHRYAFSGWQTAMGELLRRGFSEDDFFKKVLFVGHDMPLVVKAVNEGEADAGIVRACFLEDMGIDLKKYKILDPRPDDGRINCAHSTDLYPNWTVSTLPSTPPEVSRHIAAALLSMKPIQNGLHWSVGTDFRSIDKLFLDLKIGPYEYLRTFSIWRFVQEHSGPFIAFFTLIFALVLHSITVSALVRRRTAELEDSMMRERELEAETQAAQERMALMQKAGIVGQMSSIIAHELRQPLQSISMYCYGLLQRFEGNMDSRETTIDYLERIGDQTKRASEIVDQVRSYAKGDRRRSVQKLNDLVENAVREIRKSTRRTGVGITANLTAEPVMIEGNALEIELVVINLAKNAVEAVTGRDNPSVMVTLTRVENQAVIRVEDNGPAISDPEFEAIVKMSARSTKEKGLGLGLSIIRSIAEDMNGRMEFTRSAGGGLVVAVSLPIVTKLRRKAPSFRSEI